MGEVAPYHLLGHPDEAKLILLAGPAHQRIKEVIRNAGIAFRFVHAPDVPDVERLKAEIAVSGESVVVFGSISEVEGRLDRSAFDRGLIDFAYAADKVIYVGMTGAAIVHPMAPGTTMEVFHGHLRVHQKLDVVAAGETVTGLAVDRL